MRVAVVGGGAAGLTCCWMLGTDHEVVCYEALSQIGGNGRNEEVEIGGERITVAPGASFFPPAMNKRVLKLMRLVGTQLEPLPTQFTLASEEGVVRYLSPSLRPLRLSGLGQRGAARDLAGWTRLLLAGRRLARSDDWTTTWGELRGRLGLSASFLSGVADPLLAALWGVTVTGALGLSARAALGPAVPQQPSLKLGEQRPYIVVGGTGAWLDALAEQAGNLTLSPATPVRAVCRTDAGMRRVITDAGSDDYEHVVIATSPWVAAEIAGELVGAEAASALAALPETPCRIAVHGDSSFLPARAGDRSAVMMVTGPNRSQLTSTMNVAGGQAVHRSWVTWSDRLPEPCYATFDFRHVRPDPVLFEVQRRLPGWRARAGVHFAGSWVRGWDCHETAVASGVAAASAIDPSLSRLRHFGAVAAVP